MSKLLAVIVAAMFAVGTTGVFAAAHTAAQPAKDAKAAAVDCKDAKNKDNKVCVDAAAAAKKDAMKK